MLAEKLDHFLKDEGFMRRKRSNVYTRRIPEGKQTIEVAYDVSPRYASEAAAHVLPKLGVLLARVNEIAVQMASDTRTLGGAEATLFQPIDMVAPKSENPRWLPASRDDFLEVGDEIRSFLARWVVPFLNEYRSAEALVRGYEQNDWRLLLVQPWYIYVAAAYVVLNAPEKARDVVETKLGAPGSRKRFAPVFAYFEREIMSEGLRE